VRPNREWEGQTAGEERRGGRKKLSIAWKTDIRKKSSAVGDGQGLKGKRCQRGKLRETKIYCARAQCQTPKGWLRENQVSR